MIRKSDKGPGRARPPRTKTPRSSAPPPSNGEGKKSWLPCSVILLIPFGVLSLATSLLATGALR